MNSTPALLSTPAIVRGVAKFSALFTGFNVCNRVPVEPGSFGKL
jgi:hypothetical protein